MFEFKTQAVVHPRVTGSSWHRNAVLIVRGRDRGPAPIRLQIQDQEYEFAGGGTRVFDLRREHAAAH